MKTLRRSYGIAQSWAWISTSLSSGILSRHYMLQEQGGSIDFTCSAGFFRFFVRGFSVISLSGAVSIHTTVHLHIIPFVFGSYLFALVVLYRTNIDVCTWSHSHLLFDIGPNIRFNLDNGHFFVNSCFAGPDLIWLGQGSYNIPAKQFKAFSRLFQGLNIFLKAKHNWKNTRIITKRASLKAYIYCLSHYILHQNNGETNFHITHNLLHLPHYAKAEDDCRKSCLKSDLGVTTLHKSAAQANCQCTVLCIQPIYVVIIMYTIVLVTSSNTLLYVHGHMYIALNNGSKLFSLHCFSSSSFAVMLSSTDTNSPCLSLTLRR